MLSNMTESWVVTGLLRLSIVTDVTLKLEKLVLTFRISRCVCSGDPAASCF